MTAAPTPPPQRITEDVYSPQTRIVGRTFVLALMTCRKDLTLSLDQLDWMRELDNGPLQAECVITTPWDLRGDLGAVLIKRARECITGPVHHNPAPFELWSEAWPLGPNWLAALTWKWCFDHQADHILLEPDAVPLKPGWFTSIRREYYGCGRPLMGFVEPATKVHPTHVAGNACYPWDIWKAGSMRALWSPFDLQLALDGLIQRGLAHSTPSIHQFWSTIPGGNVAPTFPTLEHLQVVPPQALLFHRSKDGSLLARLREQLQLRR